MPQPSAQRNITLDIKREYKNVKTAGKLAELIDFHMQGRNRYMVINQTVKKGDQSVRSRTGLYSSSNSSSVTNSSLNTYRNVNKFRNPILNKYVDDGDDDYERKHYIFEDEDDDGDSTNGLGSEKKGKNKVRRKRLNKTLKLKNQNNNNNHDPNTSTDGLNDESNLKSNSYNNENSMLSDLKDSNSSFTNKNDVNSYDLINDDDDANGTGKKKAKSARKKNSQNNDDDNNENGLKAEKSNLSRKKSNLSDKSVNQQKVDETIKMIEGLLKDPKKDKTSGSLKSKGKKDAIDEENEGQANGNNGNENENDDAGESGKKQTKRKRNKQQTTNNSKENGGDEDENGDELTEEEKQRLFKEKNIQVNKSTNDNEDAENLTKKPKKKNMKNEMTDTDGVFAPKEYVTISTQTTDELIIEQTRAKSKIEQPSPDPTEYLNKLIDDVHKIGQEAEREKNPSRTRRPSTMLDTPRSHSRQLDNADPNNSSSALLKKRRSSTASQKGKKKKGLSNSLGITMEGKSGVNMAILKSASPENGRNVNDDGTFNNEDDYLIDGGEQSRANNNNNNNKEQVLLRKKYQNLEELIDQLLENQEQLEKTGTDNELNDNYMKLAKSNRLKVLMETSMKMVGRKYKDIGAEERNNLELDANRYHTTFPLPGEEKPLYEEDENGNRKPRMPIKIVQDDSTAKIDLNAQYKIDPSEFLKIYTNKLINHAQDSTGLLFDDITLTIPAAYGAQQREAIKNSVNQGAERDDVKILTRPVAAAVILNNQRNSDKPGLNEQGGEYFKLVFDITDASLDASVIKIKDSKDFQVISNVGDGSFGLHDVDERIVEHIIKEKARLKNSTKSGKNKKKSSRRDSTFNVETVNAYSGLVKGIKQQLAENGVVSVDLTNIDDKDYDVNKTSQRTPALNELILNKSQISQNLCKDIYDWSLAHIEKAINQADVNDKDIDEIILIGGPNKMPGFYETLSDAYPNKRISFVAEDDLAVGAAIVGKKLKYQQIKITEVLCRSIGISLYTGVITYLLFRNSSLPCVGGCVYSTLVDNQESMVLDVYEGERPHVKFCRYLGEVTVFGLPRGEAGKVKCELYLKMNNEGLLEVSAKDLASGRRLETSIDANPDQFKNEEENNETELSPIEAERFKKLDYDLVYELESLDAYLEGLGDEFRTHIHSKTILDRIFNTKELLYKNRRKLTIDECKSLRNSIQKYLKKFNTMKHDQDDD